MTQLRDTVDAMAALVHSTGLTGVVHDWCRDTMPRAAWSDVNVAAEAVYSALLKQVEFRRDPDGEELLRFPDQMVYEILTHGIAGGDCDERATLGAAMLQEMGHAPALVVVRFRPDRPWRHVYFGAIGPRGLIPLDPQARTPVGRHTRHFEKVVFPI